MKKAVVFSLSLVSVAISAEENIIGYSREFFRFDVLVFYLFNDEDELFLASYYIETSSYDRFLRALKARFGDGKPGILTHEWIDGNTGIAVENDIDAVNIYYYDIARASAGVEQQAQDDAGAF